MPGDSRSSGHKPQDPVGNPPSTMKKKEAAGEQSPEGIRRPPLLSFIDTHCHLDMFAEDRESVILRARDAGMEAAITIGSDLKSNRENLAISRRYDFIYSSVGIHPHDAKDVTEDAYRQIEAWTHERRVVAIGETGLDYHYDHSPRGTQREVFRRHLLLAKETGLPVVIHSREAREDTLETVRACGVTRGVFHCFSGSADMAREVLDLGFSISIAGPVTFKNAENLRGLVKTIPDDRLLVETDAPYLTPEPFRGKRNEPSFLVHTIRKTAELRDVAPDDVARITTLNAKRLFGIAALAERGEIAYRIRDNLYLNITNRCTNRCSFCVKFHSDYVKGHNLRLSRDPSEEEVRAAIGDPSRYREIVFCGYGEPLIRIDLVKNIARWIKERGGRVRINTNGHGNLVHQRNILPELQGIVDSVSVSLDAQDEETYTRICLPVYDHAFTAVISFIREARKYIPCVQATVVEMEGVDVERCRGIAADLGVPLRVRSLDVVG